MKLSIDTTDNRMTKLELDGKALVKTYATPREQNLLAAIDELLSREGVTVKEIKAIEVNVGPGAFTSTRVGVAVANSLGYALQVPVNDQGVEVPVVPAYGQEPHITGV